MSGLLNAWVTDLSPRGGVYSITFEGYPADEGTEIDSLAVRELKFPKEPTPERPRRHTIILSTLSLSDLEQLHEVLTEKLNEIHGVTHEDR